MPPEASFLYSRISIDHTGKDSDCSDDNIDDILVTAVGQTYVIEDIMINVVTSPALAISFIKPGEI